MIENSPFVTAARRYWDAGWHGVLHLPYGRKANPPEGFTGPGAPYLSKADVSGLMLEFTDRGELHNIALRMPDGRRKPEAGKRDGAIVVDGQRYGVVGIDVDAYKGGGETLDHLEALLCPLPDTWHSSSRWMRNDSVSGIRFYRVPVGMTWRGAAGVGIDIIQAGHRYAIVWPSFHPEGGEYAWRDHFDGSELPRPEALPLLPEAWVQHLLAPDRVEAATLDMREVKGWFAGVRGADDEHIACKIVRNTAAKYVRAIEAGENRHDSALAATRTLVAMGGEGHAGAREACADIANVFIPSVTASGRDGGFEFRSMLAGAVRIAAARNVTPRTGCACGLWSDVPGATVGRPGGLDDARLHVPSPPDTPPAATAVAAQSRAPQPRLPADGAVDPAGSDQSTNGDAPASLDVDAPAAQVDVVESLAPAPARPEEADMLEARLAEVVAVKVLRDRFCWTGAVGWLRWTGIVWEITETERVTEVVRAWAIEQFSNAVIEGARGERLKEWARVCGADKIGNITKLARGLVIRDWGEFDADPDIMVCKNGVVHLPTGKLMSHESRRLVTKSSPVSYVPDATHVDWDKATECLPADVREWYRVRLGQAITGHMTPDDTLIVAQGGGRNGKGTLHGMIARCIDSYFCLVADNVLLGRPDAHTTELTDLKGARFCLLEETPEARKLDVARLKKVVGTDKLKARRIRENTVEWYVTHSIFISSNYKPIVEEVDHGTWARLTLVVFPFTYTNEPEKLKLPNHLPKDPTLRDRLYRDASRDGARARAALAWVIEGAKRWYDAGRVMPATPGQVIGDTLLWRGESDAIMGYLADRIIFDADSYVTATDLLADFNAWCRDGSRKPWSDRLLSSRLAEHDAVTSHGVVKVKRRTDVPGLSRPILTSGTWLADLSRDGYQAHLPAQTKVWRGIRFRPMDESDEKRPEQGEQLEFSV